MSGSSTGGTKGAVRFRFRKAAVRLEDRQHVSHQAAREEQPVAEGFGSRLK